MRSKFATKRSGVCFPSRKQTVIVCDDGRFVNRPYGEDSFFCRDRRPRRSENKCIPQIKSGDLMEGGKLPRDCTQSLRPYNKNYLSVELLRFCL